MSRVATLATLDLPMVATLDLPMVATPDPQNMQAGRGTQLACDFALRRLGCLPKGLWASCFEMSPTVLP